MSEAARITDPYIEIRFENGPRGFVVVEWFDGHETKSTTINMADDNPFARITEQTNNAIRYILNEFERRRKLRAQAQRIKDQNDL